MTIRLHTNDRARIWNLSNPVHCYSFRVIQTNGESKLRCYRSAVHQHMTAVAAEEEVRECIHLQIMVSPCDHRRLLSATPGTGPKEHHQHLQDATLPSLNHKQSNSFHTKGDAKGTSTKKWESSQTPLLEG